MAVSRSRTVDELGAECSEETGSAIEKDWPGFSRTRRDPKPTSLALAARSNCHTGRRLGVGLATAWRWTAASASSRYS